ncbi:peptidase M24 [Legionella israelensis]|uniref:Peptidase M24 n=1 Tax=Legionella israelensis TaxID=454 RepID=A0AAX1EIS9_9GAMM|nr:peptidoglycan DD-metalloendopeptidase family protein [Legionella israelensis]QBR85008.1 peptidase M24 [Legionella israelensis]
MIKTTLFRSREYLICAIFFCLFINKPISGTSTLQAAPLPSSTRETQHRLKKLDAQIGALQQKLKQANNRREVLDKELAKTEKQISASILKQRQLQKEINDKEEKIKILQQQNHQLNQQLSTQQELLAKHVRSCYQIGEYQPLKWLLSQENPGSFSRVMSYYQYIIKSRKELIDEIETAHKQLTQTRHHLQEELSTKHQLQKQLNTQQQKLIETKKYHQSVIGALNDDIQKKQSRLKEFKRNKENLTHLLATLAKQSLRENHKPFHQMRRKMPYPVTIKPHTFKKMNQGVTFFAKEGTPVIAIYSGKVVFSNWLKGYGLLLIIDHGNGFMSLYAHNESLFKHKGEEVLQNEQIASVGHSGGIKENGLYFEIRHHGKAVSPLSWLS